MIIRKPYIGRPYQKLGCGFLVNTKRANLWAGMGMGKTVMSYEAAWTMYLAGYWEAPTLIIGPLRVARDTWVDETLKWDFLKGYDPVFIGGTLRERKDALKRKSLIYTTNYEQLPWLVSELGIDWPFRQVIADESTKLKGFRLKQGGRRTAELAKVAHSHVDYWWNLTGTPSPNGLLDLWGQQWFIDQGARLGRTYGGFQERWFYRPARGGDDAHALPVKPFPHSQGQIQELLRDCTLTLDPKDWFDLKEPVVNEVRVKLPTAAMKLYHEFEKTMYAELLDGTQLEVFNAAALTNKCLQLANGAVYYENGWKHIHDEKLDALESIVSESSVPPLVAYQFRSDKERIIKRFPRFVDLSTPAGLQAFKSGNAAGGVAHPKSMGHGIDGLQDVTNVLVRFGHDWNLEERQQMLERIGPVRQAQSGHDRPVMVYDIIADDTLDDTVIERHETKREVQDVLLEAMKRSNHPLSIAA